jgi:hypothetical protein
MSHNGHCCYQSSASDKSKETAQTLHIENFQVSNGWLESFRTAHKINFRLLILSYHVTPYTNLKNLMHTTSKHFLYSVLNIHVSLPHLRAVFYTLYYVLVLLPHISFPELLSI